MSLDPATLSAFLYTAETAATATAAATPATYAGMTAASWATTASLASTVMGVGSGIAQSNQLKADSKQAEAEAAANAQMLENENERNKRLLENKFEREQASRAVYFGKYGGGASALEVLAGAAESYELDKGALDTSTDLKKAGVFYSADNRAKQAMARSGQAMLSATDSLLSGGAKTYRVYKGL